VILDWAGTTVDHGSLAPIRVLQKIFSDREIKISEEEARREITSAAQIFPLPCA
jgi:phosphonoacetaldehyde hydrolase